MRCRRLATLTLERINLFPATISRCIRPLCFLLRRGRLILRRAPGAPVLFAGSAALMFRTHKYQQAPMLMAPRARDRAAHRLAESSCDGIKRLLCGTSSCPGCCGEHRRSTWGGAKIYLSEAETGDLRTSRDEMQDDEPPKQKPRRD